MKCSICWNPSRHQWRKGTLDDNRICKSCKAKPENELWKPASKLEAGGFDPDVFPAGSTQMPATVDSYAGPLAIEIMRLWCLGESVRKIASIADCQPSYVQKTIAYWKAHRGEKLALITALLAKTASAG